MKTRKDKIGRMMRRVFKLILLVCLTRLVLWLSKVAESDLPADWDNSTFSREWLTFQYVWCKLDQQIESKRRQLDLDL